MQKLIPSLNGLRALCILCVLSAHIQIINLRLPNGPGGQIGVNVFFVISGFLITLLLLKEETATGTVSLKNFFIRRSLRIFPVFYFLLLVYFVLQIAGVLNIGRSSWLSSITYTKYFFLKGQDDWETGHVWSLSVEENFYLIWPLVFVYLKRFRVVFAVAVIVAVPMVRLLSNLSAMHLFTRADALMWGCLFALYYQNIIKFITTKPAAFLFIPFMVLGFCLISKKFISDRNPNVHVVAAILGSYGAITNVCIGFIIAISITFRNNIYFAFLNSSPMDYLGKLSYSIYLWQQLFFSKKVGLLAQLPVNLICILGISVASYYLVEKPFLRLKDKFSKKSETLANAPAQLINV